MHALFPSSKTNRLRAPARYAYLLLAAVILFVAGQWAIKRFNFNPRYHTGQRMDSLNGVYVYYNGGVDHVAGRHLSPDGYNLGLKYQCVEFVKRYYYQYYGHKMPDSYGHARSFFNDSLPDSTFNIRRGLLQCRNPGRTAPRQGDLLIYSGTAANRYGHVAIVASVSDSAVEIIQQNPGPFAASRATFALKERKGAWQIGDKRILGWLRKANAVP